MSSVSKRLMALLPNRSALLSIYLIYGRFLGPPLQPITFSRILTNPASAQPLGKVGWTPKTKT